LVLAIGENIRYLTLQNGMDKIGCYLGEWAKNKFPKVQPGMGQRQEFRLHPLVAKEQDVEVDSPGFVQ
jgi:hypothetical protein